MRQLTFIRTSTKDVWCIIIPKWRLTNSEFELLRLRIQRMRSFDYIRMEIKEDTYEYYGNYHFVSATHVQNMMNRVNNIIDNIRVILYDKAK